MMIRSYARNQTPKSQASMAKHLPRIWYFATVSDGLLLPFDCGKNSTLTVPRGTLLLSGR
jgi:hypothetical protein